MSLARGCKAVIHMLFRNAFLGSRYGCGTDHFIRTGPVVHHNILALLLHGDPDWFRPVPPQGQTAVGVGPDEELLHGYLVPHVVPGHLMDVTATAWGTKVTHNRLVRGRPRHMSYIKIIRDYMKIIRELLSEGTKGHLKPELIA